MLSKITILDFHEFSLTDICRYDSRMKSRLCEHVKICINELWLKLLFGNRFAISIANCINRSAPILQPALIHHSLIFFWENVKNPEHGFV